MQCGLYKGISVNLKNKDFQNVVWRRFLNKNPEILMHRQTFMPLHIETKIKDGVRRPITTVLLPIQHCLEEKTSQTT